MTEWRELLMAKNRKWWSLVTILLLGAAINYSWSLEGQAGQQQQRQTTRIDLGTLKETVIATGVIRPMVGAEVNVGSRISGTVVNLPVEVGDTVKVDQLLAELDTTALEAAADQVRAEVALARPRVALAESVLNRRRRLAGQGLASAENLDHIACQGIPEHQAEKIFEPFVKLNPARGHRAGYGLGLNLCQRIVQAQGGTIEISSREKRGTRMLVSLPK